jgi:serine/threonine-protein kinase
VFRVPKYAAMYVKDRVLESIDVVGRTLGNYRLLEVLGKGGMGVVYRGEHSLLGRQAAIKVLRTELSRRADIVARFFNEARATSQVRHPSIVSCLDFGHDRGGSAYIVMELLEGENVRDRLDREECLPWTRAITIARQVASALGAAHRLGVVHRDLKPDNIFLVEDADVVGGERAKVLDFGIAKLADETGVGNVFKTRTGSLIGTPVYMSPEQCRGAGQVDERTDIYSLGCVLYQMVCGRPPFVGEGHGDLITMHMTVPPKPPRQLEPTVPEWLEHVILRMLLKNPDDRHGDMAEVIADLERLGAVAIATPSPVPVGRMAKGTPAPPTTLAMSAAELLLTTPVERPAARWRLPVAIGVLVTAGAIAFALAAGSGDDRDVSTVEVTPSPPPPPPASPAVAVSDQPADVDNGADAEADSRAEPPVSAREAAPDAPAGARRRQQARSKRRKVREPPSRAEPASTRVRGGIAEPEF